MTSIAADPLPSWNDGAAKQGILAFIAKVTKEGSPDFLPLAERIAVFDNDGTLGPENPMPFQAAFAIDELNQRILTEPKLASDPMVRAALAGELAILLKGEHFDGLMQVLALTHAGMTIDEFRYAVEAWFTSAKHPRYGRPYDELTYRPMQELLHHLRANGFKNFIVSGGGADFMRVWVERVYGIPPEQVVGSTARTTFALREKGPVLTKTLDHLFANEKGGGSQLAFISSSAGDLRYVVVTVTATTRCCSTQRSTTRAPVSVSSSIMPTVNANLPMTPRRRAPASLSKRSRKSPSAAGSLRT
jgi:phosphoglycolate phosphatase-like HAD superfamily hydrolase